MYIEAAEAALLAYEKRELIRGTLAKIGYLLRNGRLRVAILGPGGTGKSTLAEVLGEPIQAETPPVGAYSVSAITEEAKITGVPFGLLKVGPGQERRRAAHWPEILREISDGTIDGIIFLAAAGYPALEGSSYTQHETYRAGLSAQEWLPLFRDWALKEELAALDELKPAILNRTGKQIWMLTLVNKQDLWWDDRASVREWYQGITANGTQVNSEYTSRLDEIFKRRGNMGFEHDFASTSLEIVNLATKEDGVIKPTVTGYDEVLRTTNLKAVHDLVKKLCRIP
ncbi:Rab family GTPase [Pyxidicoccus sp. 3LFB2]